MWCYIFFAILAITAAQEIDGVCPTPTAVNNFNKIAWTGQWYVRSQYSDDPMFKGTCPFRRDTPDGNMFMTQQWFVVDDVQNYIEGPGQRETLSDTRGNFIVTINFSNEEFVYRGSVISTDYTSYAIVYNCNYDAETDTHLEFPWILVRKPILDDPSDIDFDELIEENDVLDGSRFVQNDFSEEACSFTSTLNLSLSQ